MANKKDIEVIRNHKKVEFWYKGEYYIYEFVKDSTGEAEFIRNSEQRIFGPLQNHRTEEGKKIYDAIKKIIDKEKT